MSHFPLPWVKSPEAAGLWRRLQSEPRSLLMLDYDGTLAPFHIDRFAALPYSGVEDRLAILSGLCRVHLVLVSGRPASELRGLLRPSTKAEIWGSHGWERLKCDGSYKLFALGPAQQAALERVAGQIRALGFAETLERKPSSLAIHWRSFEPSVQQQIRSLVLSAFSHLTETGNLHLLPFDGGLELRSTERTKGTAVEQILALEPAPLPVAYLGDDLTDEDAFAAVGSRGFPILVRSQLRESFARFWLTPPDELLEFLDHWIAATQASETIAGASR